MSKPLDPPVGPPGYPARCYHCGAEGTFGTDMCIERYGSSTSYRFAYACQDSGACWTRWDSTPEAQKHRRDA